ncbi:hypothetical protein [Desertivirga brevis]|uniref:hypothetical protein n=1 Tax=Desertivirga brevis TaxID=2810310 RepID=UPI001A9766F7|nr:hypothetical protein [Pedobacter sp. SYSU D00873]
MNENNLDYLKNSLKYLGFGDKLNKVLESAISQELPKFTISLNNEVNNQSKEKQGQKDFMRYDINFSKSNESDMYFLNGYHAKLEKPDAPSREHTFNLSQNNWITAKEAYNLLSGRSINKDIPRREEGAEKVNVWMKLDLEVKDARNNFPARYFYPNYGFDAEQTLAKYPLKQPDEKQKEEMLNAFRKGDLVQVEVKLNGKLQPAYVAANPEMKAMDFFDQKLQPIHSSKLLPEQGKEAKESKVLVVDEKASAGINKEDKPWEQAPEEQKNSKSVGR